MQGTYTIGELFKFLLKRWWFVLIVAVIFSAGMGACWMKNRRTPSSAPAP